MSINILTRGRSLFNVNETKIEIGESANLTLFNPIKEYTFTNKNIISKSKNSIFLNEKLKGIVYGIINNSKISFNK